jgi:hypothetical protein
MSNGNGKKEQTSFEMLKYQLTNSPLMQYPDFSKAFIVSQLNMRVEL